MTHYLQSITPSLALGGELAYQRGPGVPGGHIAVVSAAGRYTNGESTISGSLGRCIISEILFIIILLLFLTINRYVFVIPRFGWMSPLLPPKS